MMGQSVELLHGGTCFFDMEATTNSTCTFTYIFGGHLEKSRVHLSCGLWHSLVSYSSHELTSAAGHITMLSCCFLFTSLLLEQEWKCIDNINVALGLLSKFDSLHKQNNSQWPNTAMHSLTVLEVYIVLNQLEIICIILL